MSAPALVPVRLADGTVGTVPADELGQALESGAEQVTPDVLKRAELEAKYGDLKGEALAAGAGAARGLTFGLSDAALTSIDPSLRDPLNALREVNPTASLGGEIVGAVAPTLFTGGAGAVGTAARTAGAIPRGAAALGGLAERGAAALVGRAATSTLGQAAQGAVRIGARGAVEGALYGTGHEISEAALGDYEATAERLMAGAKQGALAGLAVGGALGAAGPLVRGAAKRVADVAESIDVPSIQAPGGVRQKLSEMAEERAFKSLSPTKVDERAAQRFAGDPKNVGEGARKIGRHMLEELPGEMGKRFELATTQDIAEAAGRRRDAIGKKLGGMLDDLDQIADKAPDGAVPANMNGAMRPRADMIAQRVNDEIIAPMRELPGYEGIANNVQAYVESLVMKTGGGEVSFSRLQKIRSSLDDLIFRGKQPNTNPSPIVEELRKVRGIVEDELMEAGERAAQAKGGKFVDAYKDAKSRYQSMKFAEKVALEAEMRGAANRTISLTDYMAGAASLAAGGPLASVAGALGNKVLRERGNQIAAGLLDKATRLRQVEAAAEAVDKRIASGVKGFFGKGPTPTVPAGAGPLKDRYGTAVARVRDMTADPQRIASKMAERIGDLAEHAPQTSAAAAGLEARKVAFLADKIPPGHQTLEGLQPQLARPKVSDQEMAKFLRYVKAAEDPLSVLQDLEKGRVSRESVEALQALYPSIFESIRARVTEQLATSTTKVPYQKQIQIGILFDVKTHPSLEPGFIRLMQEQWGGKDQSGPAKGPQTRPFSLGRASQATAVDRLEER